jgi:putative radical SAM enzyme (TIGR03279 family)
MLGNPKAPDIIEEIQYLASSKIRMHVQIVVCPGINDGEHLKKTINDLQKFYPYVSSIAIVPVGLTRYYRGSIRPIQRDDALRIIDCVKYFRRRLKRRHGDPMVYLADEFYLKAGLSVPGAKEYGDFPQIENGVGLIAYFLNNAKNLKIPKKVRPLKIVLITGVAFSEYLEEFVKRLRIEGLEIEVFSIKNRFFGDSVTVAGLLTGKDIVKSLIGRLNADVLFIPDVMLKHGSDIFLDDVSLHDLEESLGIKVKAIESTPEGIIRGIRDEDRR